MQLANGSATLADCALKVIATVISKARDEHAVLNVGTKLLGSDLGDKISAARGYGLLTDPEGHVLSRVYEEHAIIEDAGSLRIGRRVTFVPSHACMAANLAPTIHLVGAGDDTVIEAW